MRRSTQDIILRPFDSKRLTPPTLVPKGWDLWLYFVGAARDPNVFGKDADVFKPRIAGEEAPDSPIREGFAFGAGPKSCLGAGLIETSCHDSLGNMSWTGESNIASSQHPR